MTTIENKNGAWFVAGDITETCDLNAFKVPSGEVIFDLKDLRVINSAGVRAWVQSIDKLRIAPVYRNCPASIVMLFNMIPEFLGEAGKVESFFVPTFCDTCGSAGNVLLKQNEDYEPGKPVQFKMPVCTRPECKPEPDIDADSYFYFVEHMLKK